MQRNSTMALLLFSISACSSATTAFPDGGKDRHVLTAAEMSKSPGWSAWDMIAQLRPEFLRTRGALSPRNPVPVRAEVYVDNMHFGNLESLKTLNAEQIMRIEYLSAGDATTRFGTGHMGGAILIQTK